MNGTFTRRNTLLALLIIALLTSAPVFAGAAVHGTVAKATRGFASVVVLSTGSAGDPPTEPAVMDQVDMKFTPGVVLARVGQPVKFHNSEKVLHNVHAIDLETNDTLFNLATLPDMAIEQAFDKPGAYAVLCDVHPEMEGYVVVTDSPYAVVAAEDGEFALDVPPGDYQLWVWNVDDNKQRNEQVTVGAGGLMLH